MPAHLTRRDEFAILTLDRPEALNALSFEVLRELDRAVDEVAASDARALLLAGAGDKAFCAGADIRELMGRPPAAVREGARFGQHVLGRLDSLPMPSIAVIRGYALGGGLELALAATFRIGTRTVRLGLPEIKLGLIPGYGGTQRLPRLVGPARALQMVMTGRAVGAEEALAIGLLDRLVEEDAIEAGIGFAREMTGYGLQALRLARDAVRRGLDVSLADGLEIEADLNTLAFATDDAKEGMGAFLEKRKPVFRDR